MQDIEWTDWMIRIGFSLLLAGGLAVFFRWLKGGKGSLSEIWKTLSGSLRKRVVSIGLIALGCSLVTLLLPLVGLDPEDQHDRLTAGVRMGGVGRMGTHRRDVGGRQDGPTAIRRRCG